jgi:hypothetical protein
MEKVTSSSISNFSIEMDNRGTKSAISAVKAQRVYDSWNFNPCLHLIQGRGRREYNTTYSNSCLTYLKKNIKVLYNYGCFEARKRATVHKNKLKFLRCTLSDSKNCYLNLILLYILNIFLYLIRSGLIPDKYINNVISSIYYYHTAFRSVRQAANKSYTLIDIKTVSPFYSRGRNMKNKNNYSTLAYSGNLTSSFVPTNIGISAAFSMAAEREKLDPWFITGFSDAESSFFISIYKDDKSKLKWRVTPCFSIHIHIKDIELLHKIKNTFGVGKVRKNSNTTALFRVDNIKELPVIINHFKNFPLISTKYTDFLLFVRCFDLIKNKQHLRKEGLEQIVSLRYNLNKGITDEVKNFFPYIIQTAKPEYLFKGIPNPFWISGFVSGDSTFSVSIEKSNNKIGHRVRLIFGTCLHIKDKDVLIGLKNYFFPLPESYHRPGADATVESLKTHECVAEKVVVGKSLEPEEDISLPRSVGWRTPTSQRFTDSKYIYSSEIKKTALLQIKNYSDIENKIIPFFDKYPVLGIKNLDYLDFKLVENIVKNKEHLKIEGLEKIKTIVNRMNLDRIITTTTDLELEQEQEPEVNEK